LVTGCGQKSARGTAGMAMAGAARNSAGPGGTGIRTATAMRMAAVNRKATTRIFRADMQTSVRSSAEISDDFTSLRAGGQRAASVQESRRSISLCQECADDRHFPAE
jgi:hypothetical protein